MVSARVWQKFAGGILSRDTGVLRAGDVVHAVNVGKQNDSNHVVLRLEDGSYTKMIWLRALPKPVVETDSDLEPPTYNQPNVRRLRTWGHPVMKTFGYDYDIVGTSNWQNLKCWNDKTGWGAISNFLWISRGDIDRLMAMQIPDWITYVDGTVREYNRERKMFWLCSDRGRMYFDALDWPTQAAIKWGTTAVGGNLVNVQEVRWMMVPDPADGTRKVYMEMARLSGFRKTDWSRPLPDLLINGLVHRCYCVYRNNGFGDTPRGVVYSPFWSPLDWDFAGNNRIDALWIPTVWME